MSNILVLNLGSTSFKYELFDLKNLESLNKGECEINYQSVRVSECQSVRAAGLRDIFQEEVDKIFREILREIGNVAEIKIVGHRFVHGGEKFSATQKISNSDLHELEKLNHLAPLHNPANLAGLKSVLKYLAEAENYAVFDTAFFKDLPECAKIYPIPYEYYEKLGIYKFGFHGISHKFAAETAAKKIGKKFEQAKIITVHLGGGCSLAAFDQGKPIDTSMGYTPMEGLMMLTRSGDIDPGVIMEMICRDSSRAVQEGDRSRPVPTECDIAEKINHVLNYESGIKGISGYDDFLELLAAVEKKEERAVLAFEIFTNRVKKYIGAYAALLGEVDTVAFTGKIGAGNPLTRKKICDKMKILNGVKIVVVEPDEELAIAREIKRIIIK